MMITTQANSIELYKATGWTTLYWWNPTKPKWKLDSKKAGAKSIPAYNFDFLFEKLRPVFLTQNDQEQLAAFKLLLQVPNPADALCKLAITLAEEGLIK